MDTLGIANLVVVALIGLLVMYYGRERFEKLEGAIRGLRQETNQRFEQQDRRIERLEDVVRAELTALRSDLTRVALAVGAEPRSDTG